MNWKTAGLLALLAMACQSQNKELKNHSYSNYEEVLLDHLHLDLAVDFESKILHGSATWNVKNSGKAEHVILDIRQLVIDSVWVDNKASSYIQGKEHETFGTWLQIPLQDASKQIKIAYHTTAQSAALQWLSAEQTKDKKHPFLFSQSQAILARTWIPIMDVPAVRFTYSAKISVPNHLLALMSAKNPLAKNARGIYYFEQSKPIPSYLMALAVGNVEFVPLSSNSGVYAEPGMIDAASSELRDMPAMIAAAEELYGKYRWNRYDVLVLPPSFPFGGMENPELTFATPTILAGDRSLVSLIAHELAHSWSGNLVTNRTWNDFWLNEGFTVYFEQRIMEKIMGTQYSDMLTVNGYGDLKNTLADLRKENLNDTKLFLNLDGRDPDDGLTDIAYEKGRFFLQHLEKTVGRINWDEFLKNYFQNHAFKTMTTQEFELYLNSQLLQKNKDWQTKANVKEWIYEVEMPNTFVPPTSIEFELIDKRIKAYVASKNPMDLQGPNYSTHHWLYLLRHLPSLNSSDMELLDKQFGFTNSKNSEIQCDWYQLSIKNGYLAAYPAMRTFLNNVGRRKFLSPLYKLLISTPKGKILAKEIFAEARSGYHAVANTTIEELLNK